MFYGQAQQDGFIFERYFSGKRNGLMIEAGAFDGHIESCSKFFEESMGWSCINVEAYPWAYQKLVKNRPNSTNLGMGLSSKKQELEFVQYNHPKLGKNFGNGSFSHISWHRDELLRAGCTSETFIVPCERYDAIIDEIIRDKFSSSEVDLFVLDVEGHELDVIAGMTNTSYFPKVMCVEFPMVTIARLDTELGKLGYSLDTTYKNNAMYVRQQ